MENNLLGMRELYDVTLKATYPIEINGEKIEKGETVAAFDNIFIANFNENKDFISARGGFDNRAQVIWETTENINLTFSQGVFSKTQFALMSNSKLIKCKKNEEDIVLISKREEKESDENGIVTFSKEPSNYRKVFIYDKETGKKIESFNHIENNKYDIGVPFKEVLLDYYFEYKNGYDEMIVGERLIEGFLTLEGKTKLKDDKTGQVITGIILIPKLKLMSRLSMRLGSEANPLVATFNAIGYPVGEKGNKRVMELIYLNDDIDSDM